MDPIVCRGLLVGSNMGCCARHSSQAAAPICGYFPCKCPFPGNTRSKFKLRTQPFLQWDRRRTRSEYTRCTQGWNSCNVYEHLQILATLFVQWFSAACYRVPRDSQTSRAPRKKQRRARDEETTTRLTCMGTYHRQTFRRDNKWRYTQVKCNRCAHPVHILFCWRWACTNTNTQPRHTIIEVRNSHMDTKCDGSPDNCAKCLLTTIHCLFVRDVSPIRDCCERNTQTQDRSENIGCKDQSACTCTNTVQRVPSAVNRATRTDPQTTTWSIPRSRAFTSC